jgi:hypothetical protein
MHTNPTTDYYRQRKKHNHKKKEKEAKEKEARGEHKAALEFSPFNSVSPNYFSSLPLDVGFYSLCLELCCSFSVFQFDLLFFTRAYNVICKFLPPFLGLIGRPESQN